jgi:hypothetical protein
MKHAMCANNIRISEIMLHAIRRKKMIYYVNLVNLIFIFAFFKIFYNYKTPILTCDLVNTYILNIATYNETIVNINTN